MRIKKLLCTVLACASIFGCITNNAEAIQVDNEAPSDYVVMLGTARASGTFNMEISAKSKGVASSSFPMDEGETVRINASYYPNASVDFGLVDDDGVYYYVNVTNGSIAKTIKISKRGNYTLQIRNNSTTKVTVSGFVKY
jgi:hypothetical protein